MTTPAKLKVSLTLSADLVALVDRNARRRHDSRSVAHGSDAPRRRRTTR